MWVFAEQWDSREKLQKLLSRQKCGFRRFAVFLVYFHTIFFFSAISMRGGTYTYAQSPIVFMAIERQSERNSIANHRFTQFNSTRERDVGTRVNLQK